MSEQVETNNQQMIVIGLSVIAVLLLAIVGILVYQSSQAASIPAPIAATGTTGTDGAGNSMPPVTPPAGASTSGEFDAKTATQVPAGMTPEQLVKAYHEAVGAGKYDEAYKMLPLDKQQSYGDSKAYGEQLKAYGITGYEMGKPVEDGDTVKIDATQVTPQMPISYTWTFKKVDGKWFVAARAMAGQ